MKKFIIVVLVVLCFVEISYGYRVSINEDIEGRGFSSIEVKFPFFDKKSKCYYQENFYPGKNGNVVFLCTDPGDGKIIYARRRFSITDPPVCIITEYKPPAIWEWGSLGCTSEITMIKKIYFKWGNKTVVSIPPYQFPEKGITDKQVASVQLFMKFFEDVFQKKVKKKIKYHW